MSTRSIRILIIGGGFAGVYTTIHLQRLVRKSKAPIEITLVDRDNYFLMTPLLFEAGSGILEPRHAVTPIRSLLTESRFVEADVERIDLENKIVYARHAPEFDPYELAYDHLVIALGGVTNRRIIPGSEHALTFKTLADAIFLRNHIIDLFERADVAQDPENRRALLSFVIIGAGLVGVELMGELTEFVQRLARTYPNVDRRLISFHLIEAGAKILPEMEQDLAEHAAKVLRRRAVNILVDSPVKSIDFDTLTFADGRAMLSGTIILATGVAAHPLLKDIQLPKDRRGRIDVEATMRSKDHPQVWALGDSASIPDPQGKPYPSLAQHALREARTLARNILADINHQPVQPFVYATLGTLAALGHYNGVGRVWKFKLRGFAAWWVWRTYYLMQMPRWERRIRIMMDWTIALLFKNDIVKLDLFGEEHPLRRRRLGKLASAKARQQADSN